MTGLIRTRWGKSHIIQHGLPPAYYHSVVVELDTTERLELSDDGPRAWQGREKLYKVDPSEHSADKTIQYLGEKITATDTDEDGIVSLVLENGVRLSVTCEAGTRIHFERTL